MNNNFSKPVYNFENKSPIRLLHKKIRMLSRCFRKCKEGRRRVQSSIVNEAV